MKNLKHLATGARFNTDHIKQYENYIAEVKQFCSVNNFELYQYDYKYSIKISKGANAIRFRKKEPLEWLKQKTLDKLLDD